MPENISSRRKDTSPEPSTINITLNAFSFLQKKLRQNGFACYNVPLKLPPKSTPTDLIAHLGLLPADVEGVFVNGRIQAFDTEIREGDRIGLLPPGTPGPYRVMLGIVQKRKSP